MNEDEQFAHELRPNSIFGSLGASDHFDEDVEEYGEIVDGWGIEDPSQVTAQADPQQGTVSPEAVTMDPGSAVAAQAAPRPGRGAAAVSLFLLVGGAAIGWHFGRVKGAAGGALAAAAARNLYRAQRDMRSSSLEARASSVRPGLIGLLGLAGGGYLLYSAQGRQK